MSSNDYFAIVYKLLQILYENLKAGHKTDLKSIFNDRDTFPIGKEYWVAIFEDILDKGYIKGVTVISNVSGGKKVVELKDGIRITADGVEYLEENSKMRHAREAWGTAKDFVPMATQLLTTIM